MFQKFPLQHEVHRMIKWILILPLLFGVIYTSEILVDTQDGQTYVLDLNPDESLGEFQNRISALIEDEEAFIVAVPSKKKKIHPQASRHGGFLGYPREYDAQMTQQEKADIHFIVTSLANKSLITIALMKGDLESAGDRIDHLHPLRFLMTVFTDEEMKVGIRNIRGRGWIWNNFIDGLKKTLATEANIDNIKDEYIIHFAQMVELDVNRIYPSIQTQSWEAFIQILITEIPRKGNHDRYDN